MKAPSRGSAVGLYQSIKVEDVARMPWMKDLGLELRVPGSGMEIPLPGATGTAFWGCGSMSS